MHVNRWCHLRYSDSVGIPAFPNWFGIGTLFRLRLAQRRARPSERANTDGLWNMDRYRDTLNALEKMIENGTARADGRLPTERQLSEALGVGRRILRRALDTLEQRGQISRRQGRGTYLVDGIAVAPDDRTARKQAAEVLAFSDTANPVELIELRISLEPIMCRYAAVRSSRVDVEHLRRLAERSEKANTYTGYEDADRQFHSTIAELSRNSLFIRLQDALGAALRDKALARFGESGHCFKRQAEHVAFHHAIVDAIADRDSNRAESLMHEHLSDVHRSLLADAAVPSSISRRSEAAE